MSTKLYPRSTDVDYSTGTNNARLDGTTTTGWHYRLLSTTVGSGVVASTLTSTVAGATSGVEVLAGGGTTGRTSWVTLPLDADVTISGSITWNIWARENDMSANVAINGILEKIDGATGALTEIDRTARTTEVAVSTTTNSVNNFAETPAAGVTCKRGDRLRVRIFGDDVGTMASGFTFQIGYDGGTPAADGDTWLQLTENLTFVSEPAGTTVYPTDTASDVSTASVDREAWTSRGAGVQTDVTDTVAGWTAPIQVTDTAGGTVVDWFTRQLVAFTLGGAVRVNARADATRVASIRCEVAVVASDGTGAAVWGVTTFCPTGANTGLATGEAARSFLVGGDDVAVTDGQRLRIRFYIDDGNTAAMISGGVVTLYYAGTSGGASGDTYLTFTQTLTEYTSSAPTGTGAGTQTVQTGSATGAETFTGTGAGTGTAASASGTGSVGAAFGTGAGTGQAATASGTGLETFTGTGAATGQAASATGSGLETITGTGAGIQTVQTATGSGLETITGTGAGTGTAATASGAGSTGAAFGTGAGTQAVQTATGSGLETITGTGAGVQAVQTATGSGASLIAVTGTGAATQSQATASGSGLETITGTGAGTQTVQTATGTAAETITGTGAGVGIAATATGSGLETITGTGAGIQMVQTANGAGLFTPNAVTGTGAGTQAVQTASGSGVSVAPGAIAGTGAGVQVPGSGDGTGTVGEVEVSVPGGGAVRTFYIPRGRVTGTGSGAQVAASARGRATVNDDELVLEALAA